MSPIPPPPAINLAKPGLWPTDLRFPVTYLTVLLWGVMEALFCHPPRLWKLCDTLITRMWTMQSGIHCHDRKIVGLGHRERFNDVLYSLVWNDFLILRRCWVLPNLWAKQNPPRLRKLSSKKWFGICDKKYLIFETIPKTIQGYRGISADPQESDDDLLEYN